MQCKWKQQIQSIMIFSGTCFASEDQKLYQSIFREYNPLIRPVENISDTITIQFNLALSQIINVVSTHQYDIMYDVIKHVLL